MSRKRNAESMVLSARLRLASAPAEFTRQLARELARHPGLAGTFDGVQLLLEQVAPRKRPEHALLLVPVAAGQAATVCAVLCELWTAGALLAAPVFTAWDTWATGAASGAKPVSPAEGARPEPTEGPARTHAAGSAGELLFSSIRLGSLEAPNRLVRSATWEGLANPDGTVSEALVEVTARVARGGVGLLITGHTFVSPAGMARPGQLGVHEDAMLPGLTRLVEAARDSSGEGPAMVLQLAHAGCNVAADDGREGLGPSAGTGDFGASCREMSLDEIRQTSLDFAKGAVRAQQAGFDGVQLHAAHGYLFNQFLSPAFNRREDTYGGGISGRARLLVETAQLVRDAVGDDFCVLVKLNTQDFRAGGLTLEDSLETALMLQDAGVDGLELSGGTLVGSDPATLRQGAAANARPYYLEEAAKFRERLAVPLILTGGVRSRSRAIQALESGVADMIGLSRPLIRQPDVPRAWAAEDYDEVACGSCNACLENARKGSGLKCALGEEPN